MKKAYSWLLIGVIAVNMCSVTVLADESEIPADIQIIEEESDNNANIEAEQETEAQEDSYQTSPDEMYEEIAEENEQESADEAVDEAAGNQLLSESYDQSLMRRSLQLQVLPRIKKASVIRRCIRPKRATSGITA